MRQRCLLPLLLALISVVAAAQVADSPYLYGIHWYGSTGSTDVESMTGSKGIWDLEITNVDASVAPAWDLPGYFAGSVCPTVTGRGHSMVFRMHPYWGRNVPDDAVDPYKTTNYADDAKGAATTLATWVHLWQIGNEVNIDGENHRWDGAGYNQVWQPTPAQYAACYVAVRDKIHEVTPNTTPATQYALMQPNSPGNVIPGVRFMDGNEYLWRQIDAIADKAKIDGFTIHGYSDPATAGTDYGMEGFWDSIAEQLCIIDQFGLGDRPIFIGEFNKHMPDAANANVGAKFVQAAYTKMNAWNLASGDMWPGQPNHNILGATWFVYPAGLGWDEYSLRRWKTDIASTDPNLNPWYGFQSSCGNSYACGVYGLGPAVAMDSLWWEDDFAGPSGAAPDTTAPVPDWKVEAAGGAAAVLSGAGACRLIGNSLTTTGNIGLRTSGYAYGNFRLEADIRFVNVARANTGNSEANFDLRIREGSKGYSLTFFTSGSAANTNRIMLRRTNDWTQIGTFNQSVTINNTDTYHVSIVAVGSTLKYTVTRNGAATPVVDWTVNDSGQAVGNIRLMTWNLQEAEVDNVSLGGPQWIPNAAVAGWQLY